MAQKPHEIAQTIRERIRRSDYPQGLLPGERVLATQSGVSHMTARKAVKLLIEQAVLARRPNGRLTVRSFTKGRTGSLQIAFLAPAHVSSNTERLRVALERAAEGFQARVRPVDFVHWDDPVIPDTLRSFDGVFLVPYGEALPERLQPHFRNHSRKPLVSLELDLTAWGILSLDLFPATAVHRLLNHLAELGHRQVDCLATQPANRMTQERIAQWQLSRSLHRIEGRLIQEPVKPYGSAMDQAYQVMSRECKQGTFRATALLGVSAAEALGAMRVFHERGLRIGRDVSVCAVNDEGFARYVWPSLTSLEFPDPVPFLKLSLEWMARGGRNWSGPLLLQVPEVPLFKGDSTGRAPRRAAGR
jgi:DNA-binding LacI/PurR family transcriptional regulator